MKIKLDENLPGRLTEFLAGLGHQADTVADEGLKGHEDESVLAAAKREGRFLVTQDLDFSDIRLYQPGTHPGILVLRLGEPGRHEAFARIAEIFQKHQAEQWAGCLVVATEAKTRVRRPGDVLS